MEWLVFAGWVISQANEWEDYPNHYGEEAPMSRNWATAHLLAFQWLSLETVLKHRTIQEVRLVLSSVGQLRTIPSQSGDRTRHLKETMWFLMSKTGQSMIEGVSIPKD